jgi:hypothetical protein
MDAAGFQRRESIVPDMAAKRRNRFYVTGGFFGILAKSRQSAGKIAKDFSFVQCHKKPKGGSLGGVQLLQKRDTSTPRRAERGEERREERQGESWRRGREDQGRANHNDH